MSSTVAKGGALSRRALLQRTLIAPLAFTLMGVRVNANSYPPGMCPHKRHVWDDYLIAQSIARQHWRPGRPAWPQWLIGEWKRRYPNGDTVWCRCCAD